MKLITKINLVLVSVVVAALEIIGMVTRSMLQQNAQNDVISRAGLMMEAALGKRKTP